MFNFLIVKFLLLLAAQPLVMVLHIHVLASLRALCYMYDNIHCIHRNATILIV